MRAQPPCTLCHPAGGIPVEDMAKRGGHERIMIAPASVAPTAAAPAGSDAYKELQRRALNMELELAAGKLKQACNEGCVWLLSA